jgi:predicted nucleic acid-binding protein
VTSVGVQARRSLESVFVDTSALVAVFDADDHHHAEAAELWGRLCGAIEAGEVDAVTHSSVVLETSALVQSRIGMRAVRDLYDVVLPAMSVRWVDEWLHTRAVTALLAADRRKVSLVDWTSFELMRSEGIDQAFAFDDDFVAQGFASYG